MSPVVKKQLRRYRRMYRKHMLMQNLKRNLLDHDEGRLPPLALGALIVAGVIGGLAAGFFLLSSVFADE